MSTLIVILPTGPVGPATTFEYVLTPDGRTLGSHSRCAAALLPAPGAGGGDIVALVPAGALSWQQVTLPKNTLDKKFLGESGSPRVRAVLEGLLEDRLLDDTAQLHFALAPDARADAPVWVAVCDRVWLRAMLQLLEGAGRAVTRIVPEFAPDSPTRCLHVMGEAGDARMAITGRGGVQLLPLSGVSAALVAWEADADIVAEPAVAGLAEQLFQRPVTPQQGAQRWLLAAQAGWDLAQFDLIASGSTRLWKRAHGLGQSLWRAPRWRAARWAALVLVAANVLGLNAWAWKEQAGLKAKQLAVQEALTRTFPNVKVVVDAPLQMAREVALLRQATGAASGRDLESMLAALGSQAPAGHPATAVEFIAGEARVRGLQLGAVESSALADKLRQQGYVVQADGDSLTLQQGSTP